MGINRAPEFEGRGSPEAVTAGPDQETAKALAKLALEAGGTNPHTPETPIRLAEAEESEPHTARPTGALPKDHASWHKRSAAQAANEPVNVATVLQNVIEDAATIGGFRNFSPETFA